MEDLKPMLFTCLKKYSKEQFIKDLIAGIIVAIIALPLSIALALASGVGPERGIYTAVIAGFVISFLGGSQVQIAGPTAAFATIVAGIVADQGMDGLAVATILAGIILILMGFCRFGSLIKFIPYTITTGFTAGIAVTIAIGQLKDFCGVTIPAGMHTIETMEKLEGFLAGIGTLNWHAVFVGAVCLAILIFMPKVKMLAKIPPSLAAVAVGILMVKLMPIQVNTIGDLYTINSSLPSFHLPKLSLEVIQKALPNAFTIAILAAIESLLSCVVADGMINGNHRSNMELAAQEQEMLHLRFLEESRQQVRLHVLQQTLKWSRTPVAGMVHAVVLFLVLLVLMPYAGWIPMPTIAAILFIVAYNMCQWRPFVRLVKTAPKSDIAVLVITFMLTVVFDLVVAIEVGMVLACLLFMKRMSDETGVRNWSHTDEISDEVRDAERARMRDIPSSISVCEITGPLFFGAADQIGLIAVTEKTKCLILRMRGVPALDSTAMNSLTSLYEKCRKKKITLILSHVNDQPMRVIRKAGFDTLIGKENFSPNIDAAIEKAEKITSNR